MRLDMALPTIFRRSAPLVDSGTRILAAGTLLDTPRRDVLLIVAGGRSGMRFRTKGGRHLAFSGYPLVVRMLETRPQDRYKFLFESCERASLSLRPVAAGGGIPAVLEEFDRARLGWALVEDQGKHAVVALADLISLYRTGFIRTDLTIGEVASPRVLSSPPDAPLRDALREMVKRRVRRVFISGSKDRFVSDREILTFIFSPERLLLARESPREMLDAPLGDVEAAESVEVDGSTSVDEALKLFRPESGAWCLTCAEGVVTPWDLVMKPWKMGRLGMEETAVGRAQEGGRLPK